MDIQTLNAVINQLDKQAKMCQSMLDWSVKENSEHARASVMMWSHSLTQAHKALSAVETMLENEIAYREAA